MSKLIWKEFLQPSKECRPMARWWWTGLDVQSGELKRELDDMKEGGFGGGEIQAFTRNDVRFDPDDKALAARVHRYGTQFYFDLVRELLAKAKENDLILDITCGSGWPMGDTNITPETGVQTVIVGSCIVEGGGRKSVELPSAAQAVNDILGVERSSFNNINGNILQVMDYPRMRRELKLLRVTIAKPVGAPGEYSRYGETTTVLDPASAKDVTGYMAGGKLVYNFPEGDWQVFAAYHGPSFQLVKSDSKQFPDKESLVMNHFASGLVEHYLDRHIGQGEWEEFSPDTFRAFFADSFELTGPYFWTDNFLVEFRTRRGYELSPYLPVLMYKEGKINADGTALCCFDFGSGIGERIRHDFDVTLAEIFCEYFMEQMTEWAHKHGVKSRVQTYGHVMDNLRAFGLADIPETEQLGSAGLIDFMKVASSAALLYDKPLVTAESLVWPLRDYMETPLKFKTASDRLTISGVGQMIYHGMPYLNDRYDWPGYNPWHNAHGTYATRRNPMWPWMYEVNTAIARNQYIVQNGKPAIDVCLFFDNLRYEFERHILEELSTGELPGIDRAPDPGVAPIAQHNRVDVYKYRAVKSRSVALELVERGYDYCHINLDMLEKAVLENGVLKAGGGRFRAMVVPESRTMEIGAAKIINSLIKAGFPVIFAGSVPTQIPGFKDYETLENELASLLSGTNATAIGDIAQSLKNSGVGAGVCYGGAEGMQHIRRSFEGAEAYFVRSSKFGNRMVTLTFPFENANASIVDAWTGYAANANARTENGKTVIELPFVHYGAHIILFGDIPAQRKDDWLETMKRAVCGKVLLDLSKGWRFEAVSGIQGDGKAPIVRSEFGVGDWADDPELAHFSGTGTYEKTFTLDFEPDESLAIDFGIVGDMAQLTVNGEKVCDLITLPYAAKIGHLLKKGENTVSIAVTTTLRNGLIGAGRFKTVRQKSMSGILGPIALKN